MDNDSDIRFFLQTCALKEIKTLTSEQTVHFVHFTLNSKELKQYIIDTLKTLGYINKPNNGNTVIWSLRRSIIGEDVKKEGVDWIFLFANKNVEIISMPDESSSHAKIILPSITIPILQNDDIKYLSCMGIKTVIFITINSDGSECIVKDTFEFKHPMLSPKPLTADHKLVLMLVVFFIAFMMISIKKR